MQHLQHILNIFLHLLKSPFKATFRLISHLGLQTSILPPFFIPKFKSTTMAPPPQPSSSSSPPTTIFTLPTELHLQIISYLPFSSHITLSSTHPFFHNILQSPSLVSQRYWNTTFPAVHRLLLKEYMLRVTVLNNDIKNSKVEVLEMVESVKKGVFNGNPVPVFIPKVVATIYLGEKKDGEGSVLNDYWLGLPHTTDQPETMDLKKLVLIFKVVTPTKMTAVAPVDPAADPEGDKRVYWSDEYPFQVARVGSALETDDNNNNDNNHNHNDAKKKLKSQPPTEPATLKEMVLFITKRAIKGTGLKKEREVKCTFSVCKLGGTEGYVGFAGEIESSKGVWKQGFSAWFGR